MAVGLSGFWEAYSATHEHMRKQAVDGAIQAAQEYRRVYRLPDDEVIRVELPPWLFNILPDDERLTMANDFNLHVVPRRADHG